MYVDSQHDGEKGVDEVVDEVELHGLDGGGAGQAVGHPHVDGGQGQEAGDVHVDNHLVPVRQGLKPYYRSIEILCSDWLRSK